MPPRPPQKEEQQIYRTMISLSIVYYLSLIFIYYVKKNGLFYFEIRGEEYMKFV